MKISIETEEHNFSTKQEFEFDLTSEDIDEEEGLLKAGVLTGDENKSIQGIVEFSKDDLIAIYKKYNEVKDNIKTDAQLEAEGDEAPEEHNG